ncbi:SusC/RagA family TonB-linked outer membrane protein [Urechidicola croceus]|uniref:TonB-dependent receptor plug domain-containing protein n=1 Tax=Urechidicola croceus TaxID=1850246 RepID=A0A1D8PAG3_9FLAO|nr:TonB-dependent receptor [Urechidicola croceus]AOW21557.1 hypothetical protein LPB138_13110 [Urechidicola croceus]
MQKFKFRNLQKQGKRLKFVLALFFCSLSAFMTAQTVSGVITDADGSPLPGVNVVEKGTSNGVSSDFDGNYQISVGQNATLVFSSLGFDTQEIQVAGKVVINVTMAEDLQSLDEVVVIGYGTQLKENLSGSVSTVDTEALENIPQVSIDQMIQGRAAGVTVTQNSGQPGSSVSVRIRGVNTISGSSEPLYIIDGVPVSGESSGGDNSGLSPLAAINPSDIESVNVLKDASATAIYGSRGSNGVVIITTKRGKSGKGTFAYDTFLAVQQPTNKIEVLDLPGYAVLQNEMSEVYGIEPSIEFLRPELLGKGTNWQDEIFDNALMQNHQISFSGGQDGTNYFVSAGYLDQEGTVIGSAFDRLTVRANVNTKLNDWITAGVSMTSSRTNEKLTLNGQNNGIIGLSLANNPATAVYNPDGSFAGPVTADEIANGIRNPIAEALSIDNRLVRNRVLGNIYLQFKLSDHLDFRTELGGDFGTNQQDNFQPTYTYGALDRGENQLNTRRENNDFWVIKNLLTYHNTFNDKHDFTVLFGQEAQQSSWGGIIAQDGDFVSNDVPILGTGNANDFTDQYKGSSALESYFSRMIYTFDRRFNITASIRADGSSKFAEGNKWGYFPSISGSWNFSNEKFMENVTSVQDIKIYGGYGEVGNQNIPNFAYGSRLNTENTGLGTAFSIANYANPDLTWESSTQINVGVDMAFFDRKLDVTVEGYKKISKDFLYQLAVTDFITGGASPGAITAPWVNLGEMVNKGVDLTIGYNTVSNNDFSWNSSLTLSHYKNEVTKLLDDLTINESVFIADNNENVTFTQEGEPLGLFYGYKVDGLFRTLDDIQGAPIQFNRPFQEGTSGTNWLGDIKFKDINGDGIIDANDRTEIGNPHPDFTFGFQNSLNYKNFDLSVFMQGSYGNDVINLIARDLTTVSLTYRNQLASVLDFWSIDNPNGNAPRIAADDTQNKNISDRYIEDGSYLRIQNVTLGYTLPSEILEKLGVSKLKFYGSIQNLHTFTNYSGYDPEVGSLNQNTLLTGVDYGRYPTPRTYTMGINIAF